jgi:hypothetical protein
MLVSKMQWVSLVRRVVNISPLGEEAVLRRTLFTLKGSGKESGGPCSTAGYSEQDVVMKLENCNVDSSCEYNE